MGIKKFKNLNDLSRNDIKYLKQFSEDLICIIHYDYASLLDLNIEDVEDKLFSGEIRYINQYIDSNTRMVVYLLPKWQWLNITEAVSIFHKI